jgi:hypothetical protein
LRVQQHYFLSVSLVLLFGLFCAFSVEELERLDGMQDCLLFCVEDVDVLLQVVFGWAEHEFALRDGGDWGGGEAGGFGVALGLQVAAVLLSCYCQQPTAEALLALAGDGVQVVGVLLDGRGTLAFGPDARELLLQLLYLLADLLRLGCDDLETDEVEHLLGLHFDLG